VTEKSGNKKTTIKTASVLKIEKSRNKILKMLKMKNLLILATMLLTFGFANAQSKIYRGNSTYYGDQIGTYSDGKVYKGNSTYYGDQIATVSDGKIYKGNSTYYGDQMGTLSNGKVYKGNSTYYGDQIATLKDGKIYRGNSTYYGDQIGTYTGGDYCGAAAAFILLLW
jgi:hypothetical protein